MCLKKTLLLLLLTVIIFSPFVRIVEASSSFDAQTRTQLLLQIQKLLTEVLRLQNILNKRVQTQTKVDLSYIPYELVLFPIRTGATYLVDKGDLVSIGQPRNMDLTDKKIFELFTTVIGKKEIGNKIKEWRTYKNNTTNVDAFVELISGINNWVMGVNKEDFKSGDRNNENSFAELFVHEYAHIIIFERDEFLTEFKDKFWTKNDLNHVALIKDLSENARFSYMEEYYKANDSRFVSEYATMNADEDMAETFLEFVKTSKPVGSSLKEKKILFFYQDSDFLQLRLKIRSNLNELSML